MKKLAGAFAGAFAIRQIVQFGNESIRALADTIGKVADSIGVQYRISTKISVCCTTSRFNY